jgi:hypothetical protein
MADPYRTAALRAGRRPNLYVPEENQEWQEGQKLIGPEAAWRRNYEFVLQQTGDPQRAEAAANSIARTERRQELTQLATSVAGPVMRGGELATGLARTVMGGSRAAEAPAAMRALPPPRRNAMYPDEMLTPDVIPMGGPSFGTPRLTYAKPETRYQMAVDRPAQGRPLTNYERPEINEMFVRPEDARPFSSGSVRGTVDPLDVLAGEGGPSSEAVALAQKIARQKAEGRAATVANEEARFAGGEGPNYAEEVLNQRRLAAEQRARAAEQEARFQSGQVDAMANEGGGAGRQATINDLERVAKADFEARQLSTLDDEAGAITSGRNPPQPVARALQVVERQAAAPAVAPATGPGTGFTMIDTRGQGFTMTPPSRAMTMRTVGSEVAPASPPASSWYGEVPAWQRPGYRNSNVDAAMEDIFNATHGRQGASISDPVIPASAAGASRTGSYLPLFAGATLAGTALLSGQQQARSPGQPQAPMPIDPEIKTRDGRPVYFTGPAYDINSKDNYDYMAGATPAEVLGSRRATASAIDSAYAPVGAGPGRGAAPPSMEDYLKDRAKASASNAALDAARAQTAPTPPIRPADLPREQPGILSKIFGQPATTRQLFEQSQADPGDSGAWMRAERQYARTHKDDPNFDVTKLNDQGMKRGGAAGKSDSVHKALEIIHHLISSR